MPAPRATAILILSVALLSTLACAGPEKQSADEVPSPAAMEPQKSGHGHPPADGDSAAALEEPSGELILTVFNSTTGDYHSLAADMEGPVLRRLRAADGSWVEFAACELDDLYGLCTDKGGQEWEIEGE